MVGHILWFRKYWLFSWLTCILLFHFCFWARHCLRTVEVPPLGFDVLLMFVCTCLFVSRVGVGTVASPSSPFAWWIKFIFVEFPKLPPHHRGIWEGCFYMYLLSFHMDTLNFCIIFELSFLLSRLHWRQLWWRRSTYWSNWRAWPFKDVYNFHTQLSRNAKVFATWRVSQWWIMGMYFWSSTSIKYTYMS